MAKGVSAKFKSYEETVPRFLSFIKFDNELKNHASIVLKPSLQKPAAHNTPAAFVEEVLKFCLRHKDANAKIFIAEGSDGEDTMNMFEKAGYKQLAEKYSISLVDLNKADVEEVQDGEFLKFDSIFYPKILTDSYIIALPRLGENEETVMQGALSTMLGAFPASHYRGLFSSEKSKIRKWPIKYSIHDIVRCKMPDVAIIDASDYGVILAGKSRELDKQAAQVMGKEWKAIPYIRLMEESFSNSERVTAARIAAKAAKAQ